MELNQLISILQQLISLPKETEWVEFKQNNEKPENIGQYISALSNSAILHSKNYGYLVWGIENNSHNIIGTKFKPRQAKVIKANQVEFEKKVFEFLTEDHQLD
jgi:predicted HTH transcriptional regulator